MKNIFSAFLCLLAILIFTGCYKRIDTPQGAKSSLILAYPTGNTGNSLSSGLSNFNNALLNFSLSDVTDTLLISANLISTKVPNSAKSDINVTIGVDSSLVTAYNNETDLQADTSHQQLALMPSSYYSIINPMGTIAAGEFQTNFQIVFYPSRFDITKTGYLLPVNIVSASSGNVNPNMKTVYFHIYKDPFPPYSRSTWKVIGFDSQETIGEGSNNGRAFYCLDGDPGTYWHTQWDTAVPPGFPHWIKIDMGEEHTLHGLKLLARQNQGTLGDFFKDITVMATNDTTSWQEVGQFTVKETLSSQKIGFSAPLPNVRYFEIIVNDNFDGKPWTNLAELYAY